MSRTDELNRAINSVDELRNRLFELRDEKYAEFQHRIIPNVPAERIIGVRTPELRKLAKEIFKDKENPGLRDEFLADLPHKYFDENQLHSFIISLDKDFENCIAGVNEFLPFVDNWATCDQLAPAVFKKNRDLLPAHIDGWLESEEPYTVRFGLEMMMSHFLDESFDESWLDKAAAVRSDEYYVNMMIAWYFATALTKQYEAALPYIENRRLDPWTHNKSIQKARESRCFTDEQKEYLKSLKMKGV